MALLWLNTNTLHAALVSAPYPDKSRVIINIFQPASQAKLQMRNESDSPWLIQAWLENSLHHPIPKSVYPSIARVEPLGNRPITLIPPKEIPQDHESFYWLTVKAIPNNQAALLIPVIYRIKVFVRPSQLKASPMPNPCQLQWQYQKNEIVINNPTPYYYSLSDITLGSKKISIAADKMILPQHKQPFLSNTSSLKVTQFSIIDDNGAVKNYTPECL